jgi:hypothetical protein
MLLPRGEPTGNLSYLLLKVSFQALQFHVEGTLVEGVLNRLRLGLLLDL